MRAEERAEILVLSELAAHQLKEARITIQKLEQHIPALDKARQTLAEIEKVFTGKDAKP